MVTANQWLRIISFLLVFAFTHQALAEIYKCQNPDGATRFTDAVCKEGPTEALTLIMNSPLDSAAERADIAAYQAKKTERPSKHTAPQVIFIGDTITEERNARISKQESDDSDHTDRKSKKRGKSKKKKTKKTKSKAKAKPRFKQKKAD